MASSKQMSALPCRVSVLGKENQAEAKLDYVRQLGLEQTVCIGNGRNDRLMLKAAVLGLAVVLAEGIAGETVPAAEKIFSIFEPHTDIIIKDRRDEFYGHKICLTGGGSNLILDCLITDGNPADSTLTQTMLERQREIYGRYPLKAALDGGFASKNNLKDAKTSGVKDVCFAKKRGLEVADMCRSEYVYNRLRRFRAGIESGISWLKRSFGLWRCTWRGLRSFKSYVWCSIVAANLLTLSRRPTAT